MKTTGPLPNKTALFIARNFKLVVYLARAALKLGFGVNAMFGKNTMTKLTKAVKKVVPAMPLWSRHISSPPGLSFLKPKTMPPVAAQTGIVYFPSCISGMLGTYEGKGKNIIETFISICNKSAIGVKVLNPLRGNCCSQIFASKGFKDAYRFMANDIVKQLFNESHGGALPVVTDVSSCAYTLHHLRPVLNDENKNLFDRLTILDSVDFLHDRVMPLAPARQKIATIVLHPVCSLEKMKTNTKFLRVAQHFAAEVTVPEYAGCCGMAGDRGFLFPELTASATHLEANEVKAKPYDGYYSSTKTCEIALSEAVNANYESILYLVDEGL